MASRVVCDLCGHTPPAPADVAGSEPDPRSTDQVPLSWLTSVERGQVKVYCAACARTHLRAIESKLDAEWW